MSEVITLSSCYGSHEVVFKKTKKPREGVSCRSLPIAWSYKEFKNGKLDFMIFIFRDEPPLPDGHEKEVSRHVSYSYDAKPGKWSRNLTLVNKDGRSTSEDDPRPISSNQISTLNFIVRFLEG